MSSFQIQAKKDAKYKAVVRQFHNFWWISLQQQRLERGTKSTLRSRSHCSVFVMMRFCGIEAPRSHYTVFVQKRREKHPFLCVHIDMPDALITNTAPRISVFMRSHCSGFVKLIVGAFSKTSVSVRSH